MSSGDGATIWKTNVNRAKTKRWVEAKSYTYDGDDWGDADEYGEYGGYDKESEPPPPKPTGLRQAGKTGSPANAQSQPTQTPPSQQAQVSQPLVQPQPPYQQPDRERASSFGRGDDHRAFSGPNPPFTQAPIDRADSPASRGPPPNMVPQNRMRAPSDGSRIMPQQQPRPSFDQARAAGNQGYPNKAPWADGSRTQSLTSSSPGEYQRREFSHPSVAPQPLQTRPPRKSSLGQSDAGPPGVMQPIQTNLPENAPQLQSPQQNDAPPPTLIRPADIYRRMQEEKEKERSSQESSRPSVDTLQRSRDPSPAATSDIERKQKKPALEPVAERKSEYGMEGLLQTNKNKQTTTKPSGSSTSPLLPQLTTFDGFGQGFGDSFMSASEDTKSQVNQPRFETSPTPEHKSEAALTPKPTQPSESVDFSKPAEPSTTSNSLSPEQTLQHQGSLGFRSAVHQAFDSQIPPTPTSTTDSSLDRSNSESTNDISPIISRNVSGAAARPSKEEIPSISSIAEEPVTTPRSNTPTTSRTLGDRPDSKDSLQALRQGHRRNISTPSPDNSPARTPNVEVSRQLQSPLEAELAVTTPTTASHTASSASEKPKQEDEKPASRAGSPTKGRVRDLVDKLDSANNSRRGSDASLKAMNEQPPRPQYETQESFRPQLPGAWSSYTTNDINQQTKDEPGSTTSGAGDPFAAAAAAGSALAGALATATGLQSQETHDDGGEDSITPKDARRISAKNLAIYPEAQRLSLPRNDSDAPSSIVPTPMYMKPEGSENKEYFAPVTPLNQRRQQAPVKELQQLESTKAYEDMSTESSPNDLESDRLRKELVRELSPQAENFDQAPTSHPQDTSSPNQPQGRESTFLPSEYDSYWNTGSADGGDVSRKASELGSLPTGSPTMPTPTQFPPMGQGHPASMYPQAQNERQFSGSQVLPPAPIQSVQGPDQIPLASREPNTLLKTQNPRRLSRQFSWEGPPEVDAGDPGTPTASSIAATQLKNEITSESPLPSLPGETGHHHTQSSQSIPDVNKELPKGPEELEESSMSNLEAPRPEPTASDEQTADSGPSVAVSQQPQQAKIPAFRDIKAIKDINERLLAYDNTREQFAGMNTGLSSWIQSTIQDLPEHAELLRNGGSFGPSIRPAVQPVGRSTTTQGLSNSPASKSPFTPGAGKVTSAKGKDLLHTAGVFSGKANTAAKGFFSKGRSKLRGMGSDKAPKMFRRPSYPIATVDASSSPIVTSETVAKPIPSNQTTPSHIPLAPRSFTEPPSIDNHPSFEMPPPVFPAPPDQVDSPTLGVEPVQGPETPRASVGTPVSPISRASFENRRASLQEKRAPQRLSVDNHAALSSDLQTRLTIHQNQMKSFEDSFPLDLIIPAKYQNLPAYPNDPKRKLVDDHTPTQADFPADSTPELNTDDTSGPKKLLLSTQALPERSNSYDDPASPDYAIAADPTADEGNGARENRASSLSFIQFADIQPGGFSLKAPETPHHLKFHRESQSTFDETAFESPERDLDRVVSAESGSRQSVQQPTRSTSKSSRRRGSQPRSASTRSSLRRVLTRGSSKENDLEQLDSPTIPSDTFRVREQEEIKKQPTVSLFPKTKRRSQQLNTVPKYPNPVLQEVPATPSTAVESPTRKRRQRSSLLGNLGIKGIDTSPKSRLGLYKRAETDLPSHGTPVQLAENDVVAAPVRVESEPQSLQRSVTVNQSPLENGKKKGRFSGLSSFIGKASPRRQGSGVSTLRTVSPFQRSKLESTPEKPQNQTPPLYGVQRPPPPMQNVSEPREEIPLRQISSQTSTQGHWQAESNPRPAPPTMSVSSSREAAPQGQLPLQTPDHWRVSNVQPVTMENVPSSAEGARQRQPAPQNTTYGHWRAPSNGSQASGDYKSVFPPEFYANEPPEGYYGSTPEPRRLSQEPRQGRQMSTSSISDSAPRTAYAATAQVQKQNPVNNQASTTRHSQPPSASRNQSSTNKKPPSPKRETIRSIESNLFDIETPPPPPPKDARYTPSPSNKQTSVSRRPKRNSTPVSASKVTFSSSPITTTTTTTTTRNKRHSTSNSTGRSRHRSTNSVGDVPSNPVSPISTIKPSKSSFRRSLPPLQTKNLANAGHAARRESNSAAPQLTGTTQNFSAQTISPQTTTLHAPTVTSTMIVNSKSPEKPITSTIIQSQPQEPIFSEPVVEQKETPRLATDEAKHLTKPSAKEEPVLKIEPPPRQSSPVEKMKDEPRSASHTNHDDADAGAADSDDEIVMSSTAYPGQEWRPDFGYGGWEGD